MNKFESLKTFTNEKKNVANFTKNIMAVNNVLDWLLYMAVQPHSLSCEIDVSTVMSMVKFCTVANACDTEIQAGVVICLQ